MGIVQTSRREPGPAGRWLSVPQFGAPHRFGTRTFLADEIGAIDGAPVVRARQVHGNGVLVIGDPEGDAAWLARAAESEADAVAIGGPSYWAAVTTADCLPLLFYDPSVGAVAAVHAGWRGALRGVAPAALSALRQRFGARPDTLQVAMGPHIGACCFEVGHAVLDSLAGFPKWERWVSRRTDATGYFDLGAFVQWQLGEAGVAPERMWVLDRCTRCEPDVFSSFRREGRKPRGMLTAVRVPTAAT